MANNILLKKSSVAAKVPTVSDLDYGELALNYADGALYYKTAGNTISRLNPPESIGFAYVAVTGQSTLVADTATGTLTVEAGNGAIIVTSSGTDTLTIAHADTSSVADLSSDNSAGVVLQDIAFTFDTYGHVQTATVATTNLDSRYLQTESDTLATVTTRGATTTNAITVGGLTVNGNSSLAGDVTNVDSITFDLTAAEDPSVGKLYWVSNGGTLHYGLGGGNVHLSIGSQRVTYVRNADSTEIVKGQVVYLFGAQGDRPSVKLAYNTSDVTSAKTLGLAAENIPVSGDGWVMSDGTLDGVNTSAYSPGDILWLGSSPGTYTVTKPTAPNHLVFIGVVQKVNPGAGQIYIKVQNGSELDELHDVSIVSPQNNDSLFYDSAATVWKNYAPSAARTNLGLGTIATQNANSVAITGGAINGTSIGVTTPSTGKFTTLQATGNVTVDGNLTVGGTTTTVSAQNLSVSDNLIYLNSAIETTISNAVGSGTEVVYTTVEVHGYLTGQSVTITGVDPAQYNLVEQTITAVSTNTFTVASSVTGTYVSGGTARAHTNANPDLGWVAGYNDGTYAHTGFFRDATDGYYKVFKGYTPEPDEDQFINTAHASFALADIQAANFRGALVGNATTATTLAGTPTINGVTFNGGSNITITANTTNALTIGDGLSGTSFNGSSAVTIDVNNTVARRSDELYVGTTAIALNRASAAQTLTGVSIDGNAGTVTNGVYTTDTGTVTNTMLAGSIANEKLVNSSITIAGTSTSLGGSITLDTITGLSTTGIIKRTSTNTLAIATAGTDYVVPSGSITGSAGSVANALTLGSYLTGGSYNGSAAITAAVDATSDNTASKVVARDASGNFSAGTITATLTGTASGNLTSASTLTAGNLTGTIPSAVLGNSALYIGTTSIALNRSSASQSLTGVSIDGTSSNITAYTIDQNLGTGNSPTFTNLRATGILYDSTNSAGTNGQILSTTGTGTAWISLGSSVTGSGTTGKIPKWDSSSTLTDSIIVESSNSIGIGKTPSATLDVQGSSVSDGSHSFNAQLADTKAYDASPASGTSVALKYNVAGSYAAMGGWSINKENATDGNFASYFAIHARANGAATTEKVRVTSAGSVGIGTTTPAYTLDVNGGSGFRNDMYIFSSSTYWNDGASYFQAINNSGVGTLKMTDNSSPISLQPSGGNVGIGTTSPAVALDIVSTTDNSSPVLRVQRGGYGYTFGRSASTGDLEIKGEQNNFSGFTFYTYTGGAPVARLRVDNSGNVGIGTTSPSQALDVATGSIAYGTDAVLSTSTLTTTSTTSSQVIASVDATAYRTAKFVIQAIDATGGKYQSQEILAIHNGSTAAHTEYAAINIGGAAATFDVDFSVNVLRLLCTPLSTNSTVFKVQITLLRA